MNAEQLPVGALIVGGDHPGLGVARSLGRRGIPICVIDDAPCIAAYSKYVHRFVRASNLKDERPTIDAVLSAGRQLGLKSWVVIPTRDETVAAFSKNLPELREFFRVPVPEWETIKFTADKKNTYELAESLDIPCPKTFTVKTAADLPPLYDRLPLAVKPAIKENFFYATGAKAWRANTKEELNRLFARALQQIKAEEILLQEIIPGDGATQYSYCAFAKNGRPHSTLVARRERQHPSEFGRAATYVVTIQEPVVEELSERFLTAINYSGPVEIEFKRDPRDGKYKLLDVNARIWGFHSIGAAAGVDFSHLLFADQLGELTHASNRGESGIGWIRLITDIPTSALRILRGSMSPRSWFTSVGRSRVESVFAKDDPLPSLAEAALLPYLIASKYF